MTWINDLQARARNKTFPSTTLKEVFSVDFRSLALMRVCLALLLLFDLALRSRHLTTFYTDSGVFPRSAMLDLAGPTKWSIHAMSGAWGWQVLLFLLAAVFAFGLLVGYRTRLMSVFSWFMLASLLNRNELVLQGGDILLIVMCFWAMFLPLGARWSIDSALQPQYQRNPNQSRFNDNQAQPYFSLATIAVIIQVLSLYFFTALLKTGDAWRYPFDAAYITMNLQHFVTPIGAWLRDFQPLLHIATVYVLFAEFFGPILVLLPLPWPYTRIVGLALLASLHVAFMSFMHIGLFPLIDFMSLTVLLPSLFWVMFNRHRNVPKRSSIVLYYNEEKACCLKLCLIVRELLLSNDVQILPIHQHHAPAEVNRSWAVTDISYKTYTGITAWRFLFAQTILLRPIAWILQIAPIGAVAAWAKKCSAPHSESIEQWVNHTFRFRALKLKPHWAGQTLAGFFLVTIVLFNITMMPNMNHYRPQFMDDIARIARLDQKWSMFAPTPLEYSMYIQVEGTLRDGEKVNLYPLTSSDPNWQEPELMYGLYDGYRWRKYIDRMRGDSSNVARSAFGHYQCAVWRKTNPTHNKQLGILAVHLVKLHTNLEDAPKEHNRHLVWQHWCYPEFKPKDVK